MTDEARLEMIRICQHSCGPNADHRLMPRYECSKTKKQCVLHARDYCNQHTVYGSLTR